jgi:hypothetical protein
MELPTDVLMPRFFLFQLKKECREKKKKELRSAILHKFGWRVRSSSIIPEISRMPACYLALATTFLAGAAFFGAAALGAAAFAGAAFFGAAALGAAAFAGAAFFGAAALGAAAFAGAAFFGAAALGAAAFAGAAFFGAAALDAAAFAGAAFFGAAALDAAAFAGAAFFGAAAFTATFFAAAGFLVAAFFGVVAAFEPVSFGLGIGLVSLKVLYALEFLNIHFFALCQLSTLYF